MFELFKATNTMPNDIRTDDKLKEEYRRWLATESAREIERVPDEDHTSLATIPELEGQANSGDGVAACTLGDHYRAGDIVPQDPAAAFRWYSQGAELGDRSAQNNLGSMFLNGIGCERAPEQAPYWYRKRAEQGLDIAQYNLGKRYLHGDAVAQDYNEALKWFEKAAAQGESWACCEIGTMFRFGQGVQRNLLAAADFHLLAAERGDEVACGNLSDYRSELEEVAVSGNQMASFFLSKIYNRGFGIEKSQSMTWAWILWAEKYCSADVDVEIAQTVREAHNFYRMVSPSENRKLGNSSVAAMRKAQLKRQAHPPRAKRVPGSIKIQNECNDS